MQQHSSTGGHSWMAITANFTASLPAFWPSDTGIWTQKVGTSCVDLTAVSQVGEFLLLKDIYER